MRLFRMNGSALCFIVGALGAGCQTGPSAEQAETELLALHEEILEAHRRGAVEPWLTIESEQYVSANSGTVTFPTKEERRAMREPYLASTSFRTYRDLRSPVIRVSDDGSLGWLIAEVEVQGTQIGEEGVETPVDAVWAWIELYQRDGEDWRLVGNVSNRRP